MTIQPETQPKTVSVGSPAALLGVVPALLGFQPSTGSLVVIGLSGPRNKIKVTLRYDLDSGAPADNAAHAVAFLANADVAKCVAVIYASDSDAGPAAAALRAAGAVAGLDMQEILRVEGNRYWSCVCGDEACCPAAGTPFDPAATADLGTAVLASRDEIAAGLQLATGPEAAKLAGLIGQTWQRYEDDSRQLAADGLPALAAAISTYRSGGQLDDDGQAALITVALTQLRVRDDAWARMDPPHREAHRRLWTHLTRHAPAGYVAGPASLLAFVAWQMGDGALANVALDRALADRENYSMALLLRQVINAGSPPSLATLPMTPEEVAESYDRQDEEV